MLAIMLG